MYSSFQIAIKYFHYWITASNGQGHGIHSPFVYSLIKEVFNAKEVPALYEEIEKLRKAMRENDQVIEVEDYGAGSSGMKTKKRKIKDIARRSLKSPKYAALLYRLARFEGAENIADLASTYFERLDLQNIRLVRGNFDNTLPDWLHSSGKKYDLIYIDGNHTYEATLRYFSMLPPFTHDDTLIILDDIHWSREMEQAWEEIKGNTSVTLTIDLFFIGLVFFRRSQLAPQHFRIRF
jgi:predicted O-methyltransferase YrrM